MDKSLPAEIDRALSSYAETVAPLMELSNAVAGAMCHLNKDFYGKNVQQMRTNGVSEEEISQATIRHESKQAELAIELTRDAIGKMAYAVEVLRPVFGLIDSRTFLRIYDKLHRRLNLASETLRSNGTSGEFALTFELLSDMNQEFSAAVKAAMGNLKRTKKPSPMLEEMRNIVNKYPEILEIKGTAAKARAISEKSSKESNFQPLICR